TGLPQLGQFRRSSGTIGLSRIALLASIAGIEGTCVRPAPSRAPRRRGDDVPSLRVSFEPAWAARAEPSGVDASRFEARETVEGVLSGSKAAEVTAGAPVTADGLLAPSGAGEPQTSQYPSTYVPVQPGWVHAPVAGAALTDVLGA